MSASNLIQTRQESLSEPSWPEKAAFIAITVGSFGLTHLEGAQDSSAGSPVAETLWGIAYVLAVGYLARNRRLATNRLNRCAPLLLVLGIVIISTLWSTDPTLTLKRAIGLTGTTSIGLYIACRYSLMGFVRVLTIAIFVAAALSLLTIVFLPVEGLMQGQASGAWRGIFFQKNGLGVAMALGILSLLTIVDWRRGSFTTFQIASLILFLGLLIGARSGTAFAILLVTSVLFSGVLVWQYASLRVPAVLTAIAFITLVSLAISLGFGADDALAVIGKDSTFTGRTDVWTIATNSIDEQPVLGYGYRVFWEPDGPVHRYLLEEIGWEPDSAHNGYLEVTLGLGFVGLACVLGLLSQGLWRAVRCFVNVRTCVTAWPLVAILYVVVANFSETTLLMYNTIDWIVLVVAVLSVNRSPEDLDPSVASPSCEETSAFPYTTSSTTLHLT